MILGNNSTNVCKSVAHSINYDVCKCWYSASFKLGILNITDVKLSICPLCISWDSNKHSYYLSSPFKTGISLYPNHFTKGWRLLYRIILLSETFDALSTCFRFNWFEAFVMWFIVSICDSRILIDLFINFLWLSLDLRQKIFFYFVFPSLWLHFRSATAAKANES